MKSEMTSQRIILLDLYRVNLVNKFYRLIHSINPLRGYLLMNLSKHIILDNRNIIKKKKKFQET